MRRALILPLFFGLLGLAVFLSLGIWQVQRLQWKEGILADIEARIAGAPVAIPANPDPEADRYLPVRATGQILPGAIRVLVSTRQMGAGYRLIDVFETEGRRLLIDRGFLRLDLDQPAPPAGPVTVTGNLHWPDEVTSSTPAPDRAANIWFARDIPALAAELGTEPVLVIAREISPPEANMMPLPVDTAGIPNDHLQYAGTWFLMALAWAVMTGYYIAGLRARQKADR
ncbi:SURF1 family protein [Mesobacterium pallidum]|uniref:SURF1 family protein n=1 Tax=Mesobacterium pallidum TaxID=2872037 RepID=UPI001EE28EA4|nr:SURF1 family protein [Mesobacterium pallidum]